MNRQMISRMEIWRKNLTVCWFCGFIMSVGVSQISPILPLYVEMLGIEGTDEIAKWAGIAFGANFITLAIFSPIWGKAADKYGRKPMVVRASLWLAIIMLCMSYAQNIYQLIGLRLAQGAMSGFFSAMIPLVAVQTPKERLGWALGMLTTGQIGGLLIGPLFGGLLADTLGFRSVFLSISILAFLATIGAYVFIEEKFMPTTVKQENLIAQFRAIPHRDILIALFVTTFLFQGAMMSLQPIISVYVAHLVIEDVPVAFLAGLIFASTGLANIFSAPFLGRLSDRIGQPTVIFYALLGAGVLFIPQAFVTTPFQLGCLRFLMGLATGGLLPAINAMVKRNVPDAIAGRVFGCNQFAQHIGAFCGAILGGQIAILLGIKYVFIVMGVIMLLNALWVYCKVYNNQKIK